MMAYSEPNHLETGPGEQPNRQKLLCGKKDCAEHGIPEETR